MGCTSPPGPWGVKWQQLEGRLGSLHADATVGGRWEADGPGVCGVSGARGRGCSPGAGGGV